MTSRRLKKHRSIFQTGLVNPGTSAEPARLAQHNEGWGGEIAGRAPLPLPSHCLRSCPPAPSHCPSVLLAAPTRPPTTPPGLERFTVNFTITNLPYDSDLETPHSAKLNATQRVMTTLVGNPQVLRHGFLFSRSVRQGDNTGVDLVCTYRKEPSSPDLDRVGLYHEVSNKTRAITRLGPYSLDRTSLYVNGEYVFLFSCFFITFLIYFEALIFSSQCKIIFVFAFYFFQLIYSSLFLH
uniref:SEA domain-containing protein n=1 Tax=Pavo cristatus TaxID=9049 RepID=A0A8C9LBF9_PAVCR